MKNKALHTIYAVCLSLIVILPFSIQTVHALQEHEHKVCIAKEAKHFHDQASNCGIYHLTIEQNSIDLTSNYDLEISSVFNFNPTFYCFKNYHNHYQLKSSRAPPILLFNKYIS